MAEHIQDLSPDEAPKLIHRNGSTYTRILGSTAVSTEERVDTIIYNLVTELSSPAQVEVLETVIRPALLKYGAE
jgi:hypothetical protein